MNTPRLLRWPAAFVLLAVTLGMPAAAGEDFSFAFEGNSAVRERLTDLQATATPPALELEGWINSEPLDLADLKGRVVVLHFWAAWCVPCLDGFPRLNALAEKYRDQMVLIGICHPDGAEKMVGIAAREGLRHPLAIDAAGATIKAYRVNGYPDFQIIAPDGRLAVADCANEAVEKVVETLVAKMEAQPPVAIEASAEAVLPGAPEPGASHQAAKRESLGGMEGPENRDQQRGGNPDDEVEHQAEP